MTTRPSYMAPVGEGYPQTVNACDELEAALSSMDRTLVWFPIPFTGGLNSTKRVKREADKTREWGMALFLTKAVDEPVMGGTYATVEAAGEPVRFCPFCGNDIEAEIKPHEFMKLRPQNRRLP